MTASVPDPPRPLGPDSSLLERIPLGVYRSNPAGKILYANPAMARIYGFPDCKSLLAVDAAELYPPEFGRARWRAGIESQDTPQVSEAPGLRRDGCRIWVRETVNCVRDDEGRVLYYEGVVEDVTQRRAHEEALRAARQDLDSLIDSIEGIVWEADARTFQFTFVSGQAERLLGYPKEQWLSEPSFWGDHIHPDDRAAALAFCVQATAEKRAHEFEYRMLAQDGHSVWVRDLVTVVVENDVPVKLRGVIVDVSRRQQAESELRKGETRFRSVFEAADVGISIADIDGYGITLNAAYLRMLGLGADEVRSIAIFDELTHPDDREADAAHYRALLLGGSDHYQSEKRYLLRDGRLVWVSLSMSFLRDARGKPEYVLGMAVDITERKRAERLQAALHKIAEQASVVEDVADFCRAIHAVVAELMPARNFYIALHDEAAGILSFPYFVDEADPPPAPRPLGRGITEYVLRSGEPLLAGPEVFRELVRRGEIDLLGEDSIDWLGVPLKARGRTIGMLAVQSYQQGVRYGEAERDVLVFVSGQIATAIGRKRAEEALRASEERYRLLVENAPICVHEIDRAGRFLSMNPAGLKMTGFTDESQVRGRSCFDAVSPADRPRVGSLFTRAFEGESSQFEFVPAGEGEPRLFASSFMPVRGKDGTIKQVMGITEDITERRRAEDALRQSESILRSVFDSGSMLRGVVELLEDDILHISDNAATASFFGTMPKAMQNRRESELGVSRDTRRLWLGYYRESERTGHAVRFELLHESPDGPRCLGATVVHVGKSPEGRSRFTYLVEDVTELRALEEQLRQALKMEAVGRLAGGVAHDFNNLLGVITGYGEMLLKQLGEDDPRRQRATQILKAAGRAADLTRQLLAFSRQQVLQPKVLDLNVVVSDMDKMLRRLIGEDVELAVRLESGLGRVMADAGQIELVIMNLAVNARDAMPDGGQLTIETHNVDLDALDVANHPVGKPGRYVLLVVSDTGSGMDAATQSHIFEPFFTTKELGKGTGLGLSTVYGIVKQSDGYIWVYSEVGVGTSFKVYLPRSDEAAPVSSEARSAPAARGSETVLLVEDEAGLREMVREILEDNGYALLVARDGAEALQIADAHAGPIDLMITDVIMPGMTGRSAAEQIVATRPEMKVLYMSGYSDEAVVRHGMLGPGSTFLSKPFALEAFLNKVRELLDPRH